MVTNNYRGLDGRQFTLGFSDITSYEYAICTGVYPMCDFDRHGNKTEQVGFSYMVRLVDKKVTLFVRVRSMQCLLDANTIKTMNVDVRFTNFKAYFTVNKDGKLSMICTADSVIV